MRFDSIDLIGDFKINGLTGGSGQAIGFSGSSIEWIEASTGGTPVDVLPRTGYNYIIVGATGSPSENGQALIDAYTEIQSFNIGTLGVDNRLTILLMPGIYGPINISITSFVDIQGMSTNPQNTILFADTGLFVNTFGILDFSLSNLYISSNTTVYSSVHNDYLRFKNLVIGGNGFDSTYLNGEFEDITIENFAAFGGTNEINGVFKNIEVGDVSTFLNVTIGGNISGTFSNINVRSATSQVLYTQGNISGTFRNINVFGDGANVFYGADITGDFKDINIQTVNEVFVCTNNLGSQGTRFENIRIKSVSQAFIATFDILGGVYKNIYLDTIAASSFYASSIYSIYVDNIVAENIVDIFMSLNNQTEGIFKNIKIGYCGQAFIGGTDLLGTYSNIEMDYVSGDAFYANNIFNANVNDLKLGTVSGNYCVHSLDSDFYGKVKNFEANYLATGYNFGSRSSSAYVIFDNIKIGGSTGDIFRSGLYGYFTISNVESISRIEGDVLKTANNTFGAIRNFKMGRVGNFLTNDEFSYYSRIENIEIDRIDTDGFSSKISGIYCKDIRIGQVGGNLFYGKASSTLSGHLLDINIGDVGGDLLVATGAGGEINSFHIDNLKIGNVGKDILRGHDSTSSNNLTINGCILKNIEIKSGREIFRTKNSLDDARIFDSLFQNITIGSASTIFNSDVNGNVTIRNLNAKSRIPQTFRGYLMNSTINALPNSSPIQTNLGARHERNKLLGSSLTLNGANGDNSFYGMYATATFFSNVGGSQSNIIDPDIA